MGRADPSAIDGEARGGAGACVKIGVILEKIDEGLAGIGLGEGARGVAGADIELGVSSTAAGSDGRSWGRALCKCACCEGEKQNGEQSLYGLTPYMTSMIFSFVPQEKETDSRRRLA
jgi:hypothetical protein